MSAPCSASGESRLIQSIWPRVLAWSEPTRSSTYPCAPTRYQLFEDEPDVFEDFTAEYVLWTPHSVRELRELVPYFNSYFSSPVISASVLYYWGITPGDDLRPLYAMRYDFRSGRLDSLYVRMEGFGTDYRYYLPIPRIGPNEVTFGDVRIDPSTWRAIHQRPPSN